MKDQTEVVAGVETKAGHLAGAATASEPGTVLVQEPKASVQKSRKVHRQIESCLERNQSEKNGLLLLYYNGHTNALSKSLPNSPQKLSGSRHLAHPTLLTRGHNQPVHRSPRRIYIKDENEMSAS